MLVVVGESFWQAVSNMNGELNSLAESDTEMWGDGLCLDNGKLLTTMVAGQQSGLQDLAAAVWYIMQSYYDVLVQKQIQSVRSICNIMKVQRLIMP